ncbi:hypothetical protein F4780DRAFT_774867 [Xylariomycetidae sp. FL0641]|nr:hypothetical protein F4780DRAFT_774867 [Xylariomycetidae sp. FL0641]
MAATTSKPFKVLVGPERTECLIDASQLAALSPALNSLVNNGMMRESRTGVAEWPEVDAGTFARLAQFAQTGDYAYPEPVADASRADSGGAQAAFARRAFLKARLRHDGLAYQHDSLTAVGEAAAPFYARGDDASDSDSDGGRESAGQLAAEAEALANTCRPDNDEEAVADDVDDGTAGQWATPIPWYPDARSETLWERFRGPGSPTPAGDACERRKRFPAGGRWDYREVYLANARLYVVGDYYGIAGLMELSLRKLHSVLLGTCGDGCERIDEVLALLAYAYENTVDRRRGGEPDALRDLLSMFVACKADALWEDPRFRDLLADYGEIARDIIGHMVGGQR